MGVTFDKRSSITIKGIAVLLMVYHHLFIHRSDFVFCFGAFPDIVRYKAALFGKICVSVFFFLSGFGINRNRSRVFNFNVEVKKVVKRLRTLFLNYWKVFLLFVPLGFMLGKIRFSAVEFILNFIGWEHSYNIEWWVIRKYTLIVLLSPALSWFFSQIKIKQRIFVEVLCGIALLLLCRGALNNELLSKLWTALDTMLPWILCFFSGYLTAEHRVFERLYEKMPGGGGGSIYSITSLSYL